MNDELDKLVIKIKDKLPNDLYHNNLGLYGPFGSNGGLDCLLKFIDWRMNNINESAIKFLMDLGYPIFDWHNLNELQIQKYIHESENNISQVLSPDVLTDMLQTMTNYYKEQTGLGIKMNTSKESNFNSYVNIVEQDLAVISIAFGQFVVDGKTDKEIILLAESAIKRQLLKVFIEKIPNSEEKIKRQQDLSIMLGDLNSLVKPKE